MEQADKELGLRYAKAMATPPQDPKTDIDLRPELWLAGQHVAHHGIGGRFAGSHQGSAWIEAEGGYRLRL